MFFGIYLQKRFCVLMLVLNFGCFVTVSEGSSSYGILRWF